MAFTASQEDQLKRIHGDLSDLLLEVGLLEPVQAPKDPQWLQSTAKQWGLISAAAEVNGGDLGADQWGRLGRQHGYDPRGLGGFFRGSQPLMASQGQRRIITIHGRRFIDRWRADFGTASTGVHIGP